MGWRIPLSISDYSIVTIKSLYSVLIVHVIWIHCRLEIGMLLIRMGESHWLICHWMIHYWLIL